MLINIIRKSVFGYLLLIATTAFTQPKEILLWPNGAPGSEGKTGDEKLRLYEGEHILSNIHHPSITPYLPLKEKARLNDTVGQGKLAPVIGTVCMDMTMIDISNIPGVEEGDEVVIFGKELPVQQVAAWAETIPYEIMTGISQRVNRVYFEE